MILHDAKAEETFEALIDCCFPYDSPSASALIRQGWSVSLNAAFCVLHELCRPPKSADVNRDRLRELVDEWAAGPDHPIKAPVLLAAQTLIDGAVLQWHEGVELMRSVAQYDGQRAALCILYFASYEDSPEADEALTRTDEEIRQRWDAMGV